MTLRKCSTISVVGAVILIAIPVIAPLYVRGQARDSRKQLVKPAMAQSREVTLHGTVVCIHTYVTGEAVTPEKMKAIGDAIRNGAPAALETKTGLVVLGQGTTNPGRLLFPYAMRSVKIKGRVYDKGGFKYLDFAEVKQAKEPTGDDENAGDEEDDGDDDDSGDQ